MGIQSWRDLKGDGTFCDGLLTTRGVNFFLFITRKEVGNKIRFRLK